jgi:hypothetical protein
MGQIWFQYTAENILVFPNRLQLHCCNLVYILKGRRTEYTKYFCRLFRIDGTIQQNFVINLIRHS